mmetsp:Transcript_19543/g.26411  ORF Transcript_19543/g.26411 Transcript_19543/m.26411 type:complete len:94 (+) Transcript_19543:1472-1753(+)
MHYNEQEAEGSDNAPHGSQPPKKERSCGDYLKRIDQLVLRPILIHKYEKDKEARARDFYDMFQAEGGHVRKLYEAEKKKKKVAAQSERGSQRS